MTEHPDAGRLISIEHSDQTEEDPGKKDNTHGYESYYNAMATIHAVREDFGRQLELASDRQNAMVQSVGIILAFASILLIESIRLLYPEPNKIYNIIALASFLMCCATGIATIWRWKNWELYSGLDFNKVINFFNMEKIFAMHFLLLKGVIDSHDMMRNNNFFIKKRISIMAIFLSGGIALMLMGLVAEWV